LAGLSSKRRFNVIKLTKREQELVDLACKGAPPLKIKKQMGISSSTYKMHVANASKKLNVQSRYKLKGIIKAVTGRKFLRYRTDKKCLYDTSTGSSVRLDELGCVADYLILNEKDEDVTQFIARKVMDRAPRMGFFCDCKIGEFVPVEVLPGGHCVECGSSAVYKDQIRVRRRR
jgi:DNA-binding CsgD family transcriptional regulator